MKRDTGILLAGSVGVIVGLGIYGFKWFLNRKHTEYQDYYADFHRHFDNKYLDDSAHGIEFLAML